MLSARNRELLGLVPAALLVTAGFAAIFIQADNRLSTVSLTYGGVFLALCLAGAPRDPPRAAPRRPLPVPARARRSPAIGIVMLYRINPTLARQQAQWLVVGLVLFAVTIVVLRGGRYLRARELPLPDRDRRASAACCCRACRGSAAQVNGAYLAVHVGPISFQPSELGKIAIVIFLASYLRDNRQVLVTAGRRVLGVTIPPMKQFGPLLLVWGSAMAMLLVTREIGTSLMFFGAFLALLYVATGRCSFPVVGLVLFAAGAYYLGTHVAHVHDRVTRLGAPVRPEALQRPCGSYQLANGLFAQADGGLLGVGFGQSLHQRRPRGADPGRPERLDLRGDHRRDRPRRRGRRCSSPTCCSSRAASRSRRSRATRSRSCSRPDSRSSSRCRSS